MSNPHEEMLAVMASAIEPVLTRGVSARRVVATAMEALEEAGYVMVRPTEATRQRTVPAYDGAVHRADFGHVSVTYYDISGSWWIDHQGLGRTIYDSDPGVRDLDVDYLAALRWIAVLDGERRVVPPQPPVLRPPDPQDAAKVEGWLSKVEKLPRPDLSAGGAE